MKSKVLFFGLAFLLFGGLLVTGILSAGDKLLFAVIEGFTVIAIVFTIVLYRMLIKPYDILLTGMELLKEQDFSTRLRRVGNPEADQLIGIFNQMIGRLREERLTVREANQFLDLLVKASPQGIIILDFNNAITDINPAGLALLNIESIDDVIGKKPGELPCVLAPYLEQLQPDDNMVIKSSATSIYRCIRSSFSEKGFNHPFILIEELTREILKVEKQSYENIIRVMSHEVNNSIGAIGSTLNVISDAMQHSGSNEWDDVLPVVDVSIERCRNLSDFVADLSDVVKIPAPNLSYISVNNLVDRVGNLVITECNRRNIQIIIKLADADYKIYADIIQLENVLVNIIKNAYESIDHDGTIHVVVTPSGIVVQDDGPGISENNREKLFTSFFTTKPTGHGIGLMFVREVLLNHNFGFSLSTKNGITEFRIVLV